MLSRLDGGGDTLRRIISLTPKHDAYCVAMVSVPFRDAVRVVRCPTGGRGLRTPPAGVLSSSARVEWAYSLPDCRPPWWDAKLCEMLAERGLLEGLQWARAHGCEWNARTCYYAANAVNSFYYCPVGPGPGGRVYGY